MSVVTPVGQPGPDVLPGHNPVFAQGKFFFEGSRKLWVRGVTYGTFRTGAHGGYPDPEVVRSDFALMARSGVNAVRTYTVPPTWLLDEAGLRGLRVLVGLPWEHHVAVLADRAGSRDIVRRVREGARTCARHPAVLGLTG